MRVLYERCAGIDVGKDVIAVAVRRPGKGPDGRVTEKRIYKTFYGVLAEAAGKARRQAVTRESGHRPRDMSTFTRIEFTAMTACLPGHA